MSVVVGCAAGFMLLILIYWLSPRDPIQDEIDDLTLELDELQSADGANFAAMSAIVARIKYLEEIRDAKDAHSKSRYYHVQRSG